VAVLAYAGFDASQAFQHQSISERYSATATWIFMVPSFVVFAGTLHFMVIIDLAMKRSVLRQRDELSVPHQQ
jgi:hypothetical protein